MCSLRALAVLVFVSLLGMSASAFAERPHLESASPYGPYAIINFPQLPSPAYAGTSITLTAVSSDGQPVMYTVVSGPASISGSTLTYLGAGTVTIEADANGSPDPPTPVQHTVTTALLNEQLTVSSAPISTVVTFLQAGTLGNILASSQGATGSEFVETGGTCATGLTYAAGDTCTIAFIFTPQRPGLRFGGIALSTATGDLLANSYIVGLGTGPQILYTPPNQIKVGVGFGGLSGVAVDGSGNVYGSDIVSGGIYQVPVGNGTPRQIAPTLFTTDVSVDGSGNIFYADRQKVYEILAVNGVIPQNPIIRTLADGFISIDGLKVDAFGNVYIAEGGGSVASSSAIEVLQAINGTIPNPVTPHVIVSGVGTPTGVAVDIYGDVFFSDEISHSVYEVKATNGVITSPLATIVSSSFTVPTNVTMDVSGNLYVPDEGTHDVKELLAVDGVLPANPTIISRGQNLATPEGATVDASGNLYVADSGLPYVPELAYGAPPTLTFAPTQIGQTSSDSPMAVSITNGGNADLVLSAPTSGTNPFITSNFTIDPSSNCPTLTPTSSPGTLSEGASCTTAIDFTPLMQGPITGQLVSTDNNQGVHNSTQTILFNGTGLGIQPTITFLVSDHTYGDPPFTVATASNSAGAFTYSVVSGPATVFGSTVTLTGAGSVTLRATQAADGNYAAGQQDATFQVNKAGQTITFAAPKSPVPYNVTPITLQANATSGLPVSFSVISGPGQLNGNVLSVTGGGTIIVAADQPGNVNFLPAPQVRETITVTFGPAFIVFTATPTPVFVKNPVQFHAVVTGGGGAPTGLVQFLEGNSVLGSAMVSGGNVTANNTTLSLGTHTITAVYGGDRNFASVSSSNVTVVVEDFKLTNLDPAVTINHGGAALYSFAISPIGGPSTATDIQFSMQGGPEYARSSFSKPVLQAGSGASVIVLTLQTPNFPSGQSAASRAPATGVRMGYLAFAALGLALLRRRRRFNRGWMLAMMLLFAGAACSSLTGCGSGWRTQGWTLSVTAASGNLSHTAGATLTSRCEDGQDACSVR